MFVALRSVANKQPLLFSRFYKFGIIKFKLPDLGEKIKEGTIKKLYVTEGDTVEEFQKLADVASDKQFT
jgi:2-oxoisovalerate dehydrogenase E2 component (dihydrolipoyl transacylase)